MSFLENVEKNVMDACEFLNLDDITKQSLITSKRELNVNFPVRMDNGKIQIFKGFRVIHNDALGYTKGGIRFHQDETLEVVKSLASLMTWKTSLAGLPLGGAKGGVVVNPKILSPNELERVSRGYIRAIADSIGFDKDVPAPDVGTDAKVMSYMLDEFEVINRTSQPSVITGKPICLGGSKGRNDATAMGGIFALESVCKTLNLNIEDVTVAIQGYGNAGYNFARLAKKILNCKVVGISDSKGSIFYEDGFDVDDVFKWKQMTGSVIDYKYCDISSHLETDSPLFTKADIIVPSALENVITKDNADKVQAKIILELANGPTTPDADKILYNNEINIIPDILANSGGVIVSHMESIQNRYCYYWDETEVYRQLENIIKNTFEGIYRLSRIKDITMRQAAYVIAIEKVVEAMKWRGII